MFFEIKAFATKQGEESPKPAYKVCIPTREPITEETKEVLDVIAEVGKLLASTEELTYSHVEINELKAIPIYSKNKDHSYAMIIISTELALTGMDEHIVGYINEGSIDKYIIDALLSGDYAENPEFLLKWTAKNPGNQDVVDMVFHNLKFMSKEEYEHYVVSNNHIWNNLTIDADESVSSVSEN